MSNLKYIIRHVSYFRGKPGHEFALVYKDTVLPVPTDDPMWSKLLDRPGFVGLVTKAPKTRWGGMVPLSLGYDGMSYVIERESIEDAAIAVREEAERIEAEAEREAFEPAYALEKLLKSHDWFAHYSDDYRVLAASDAHWHKIETLRKLVPQETYDRLIEKYRPKTKE